MYNFYKEITDMSYFPVGTINSPTQWKYTTPLHEYQSLIIYFIVKKTLFYIIQ